MAKITVEVVTPEKKLLSLQVDEAIVPGADGLFGVRPGHTPFLSVMDPGPLTLKDGGVVTQSYFVAGGFVQVANDRVMVLADEAQPVSAIDVAGAAQRLRDAQERLKGMTTVDERYDLEAATVRKEAARMTAAGQQPKLA